MQFSNPGSSYSADEIWKFDSIAAYQATKATKAESDGTSENRIVKVAYWLFISVSHTEIYYDMNAVTNV